MVEGQDAALVDELAEYIADVVQDSVNAKGSAEVVKLRKA